MHSFKNADMIANICRRRKAQTTNQSGAKIRYNITLQVGQHHHIESIRSCNQFHAEIIHNHIICFQFRIFFCYFIKTFQEQAIGYFHDIGLMTAGNASCIFFLAISKAY